MSKNIELKKGVYESAKINARKAELISEEQISTLSSYSYEEILKYLEEHGFQEVIDKSYLSYEGFYLIEKVLNDYLAQMYSKFFRATSNNNQKFLENYYLKYQIHNLMATIRCQESSQEELEPYLIGDSRRKEKYLKAFDMSQEEALRYLSKKLGFDAQEVINFYNKGIFELENYLYQQYYKELVNFLPQYSSKEDKKYQKFIKSYIDLQNGKTYFVQKDEENVSFEDLFIEGGNLTIKEFQNNDETKIFKKLSSSISYKISSPVDIDKATGYMKKQASQTFSTVSFGSPYALLGFFFTLENSIGQIRKLLKAKYMGVSQEEFQEVMKNE